MKLTMQTHKWERGGIAKLFITFLCIFVSGILAGIGIPHFIPRVNLQAQNSEVRSGGYKFINPLLECNISEDNTELIPFKNKLQDSINQKLAAGVATKVSIYFRDLNNGPWIGINQDENFAPASLLKVPLMMSYYKEADTNPSILEKKMTYANVPDNDTAQNFKPSRRLEFNKSYTADELIKYMIAYSENNAYALLVMNTDDETFSEAYKDLGFEVPGLRTPDDFISVQQYGTFFRILYNASYLSKAYSEKALSLLSQVQFRDGLVAGVPKNIRVAHKFGERNSNITGELQLHDCGIVYYPKHPYLLCVMTRGIHFSQLASVIKDISKITYEEVDRQIKANN